MADARTETVNRPWALASAALTAVALAPGILAAVRAAPGEVTLTWLAVAAAGVGAVLVGLAALGGSRPTSAKASAGKVGLVRRSLGEGGAAWLLAAAVIPLSYLVLSAAPRAVTGEWLPMLRLLVALAAGGAYFRAVVRLSGIKPYAVCCEVLAVGALFFALWEPPAPTPVPIAKPLRTLEAELLAAMPGWTGHHEPLDKATESVLKADEYLNLRLKSANSPYQVLVYVTYNANAMSNIPHVPWVCMTQAGYDLVSMRQDDVLIANVPGKEIRPNVIVFEGGTGRGGLRALMFQYFNVGGTYETDRQLARFWATSGSLGQKGSFLSQTQVVIWIPPGDNEDPMVKGGRAYRTGLEFLDVLVPRLEREYYPNLRKGEGG